jgi:hypothetical protein
VWLVGVGAAPSYMASMRLLPLLIALHLPACDPDGSGFGGGGGDTDTDIDTDTDRDCGLVTLSFRSELATISGEPFGLSYATDAGRTATGTMTYDTCVADTDVFESEDDGVYDHIDGERGAFSFALEGPGTALEIQGSVRPVVGIRGLDWFDFEDGGYDVFEDVARYLTVNGEQDQEADLFFTIGSGAVDFDSDDLPAVFPMSGTSYDDFACMGGATYCVTFSVGESTFGDTFLMRLLALQQLQDQSR